jgi:hypothetical protein
MTEDERRKRLAELRARRREIREQIERNKVESARVLALIDHTLQRLRAAR